MLRNLARPNTNGGGILGTHLVGVPASALPVGFPLAGLLNNDVAQGDPAGTLYRVEIIDWPSAGELHVEENGAFSFTDAPDGTYTGATKVYKSNLADAGSYSFTVGEAAPELTPVSAALAGAYSILASVSAQLAGAYQILSSAPPAGDIDASKVPASRKVIFSGGVRTVVFSGGIRTVRF